MDAKLLQRVMDLAERTGDRVIVVNPQSGEAHAIMPFDAYEELVDNRASLRDLFNEGMDDGPRRAGAPDFLSEAEVPPKPIQTMTDEEIEKAVEHDIEVMKMAEASEKNEETSTPLDILDDEANEEEYYLEPLE